MMKDAKRKKLNKKERYYNPKKLSSKINEYGFQYSYKQLIETYIALIVGTIAVGILYQLRIPFIILSLIGVLACIPSITINSYKRKHEETRLTDVATYIETMLYSFQKQPMVLEALNDAEIIFEDGEMKDVIIKASEFIKHGYYEGDISRKALEIIEEAYPSTRIRQMHDFVTTVGKRGGTYEASIDTLLSDKNLWLNRCIQQKNELGKWKRNTVISIIICLLVCCFITKILPPSMSIYDNIIYQFSSVISFYMYLIIYVKLDKKVSVNWISDEETRDEESILRSYYKAMNYDTKKERKKSILFAIIPVVIFIISFIFKIKIGCIIAIPLLVVMLNQHKLDLKLAQIATRREVEMAFPDWLRDMSLLLQADTVQIAIAKSYENAPIILKPELKKMMIELDNNAESIEPYINFMKSFTNREIVSAMKMLYSINKNSTGDTTKQIAEIISRTNTLRDNAEKLRNENGFATMYVLFAAPILAAGFKILTDLTILMFSFLTNLTY